MPPRELRQGTVIVGLLCPVGLAYFDLEDPSSQTGKQNQAFKGCSADVLLEAGFGPSARHRKN